MVRPWHFESNIIFARRNGVDTIFGNSESPVRIYKRYLSHSHLAPLALINVQEKKSPDSKKREHFMMAWVEELERDSDRSVVSSTAASLWWVLRTLRMRISIEGYGRRLR